MTDCFSFMNANGMGWMIWAHGLSWLLILTLLVLGAAALIKYLRTDASDGPAASNATMRRGEIS